MSCKRALLVLVGHSDDHTKHELLQAREHASRCPNCSSAYDCVGRGLDASNVVAHRSPEAATGLRIGLTAVAIAQLVFAGPWLFGRSLFPDTHVAISHLTRDGALGLVITGLGLVTAWRPRYVHSTMLIGLLVFGTQLFAGLADRQSGTVSPAFEIVHVLLVAIVFGQFGIAADMARRATPRAQPRARILR